MRVLIQEVSFSNVKVDGKVIASIGPGFLIFSAFKDGDDITNLTKMADKISKLRIFPDQNGKTNLSLKDVGGEVLSVSQFTLYASCLEGNRPSFIEAMRPEKSKPLFAIWNNLLEERFGNIGKGIFGADMKVELCNEGPFTLWLDSDTLFPEKK